MELNVKSADNHGRKPLIAVAATFTAEPLEDTLRFWIEQMGMEADIEFAPYNQVFQELLNPTSLLSQNESGINAILIGFEDWMRYDAARHENANTHWAEKLGQYVEDLIRALRLAAERSSTACVVCLCPATPKSIADARKAASLAAAQQRLLSEFESSSNVYVVTSRQLAETYPVADYYDEYGDRQAHIPYTAEFYAALGTMIVRRIYAISSAPYKVIVLDCDQTLWRGRCGEVGAAGIEIGPARRFLQQLILEQLAAGMLLCICSRNNHEDVAEVFDCRDDMPLRRDHFAGWRVNWQAKSENIRELAAELGLGLDSFIFIDDNPLECAEVAANCPEVLTLELPEDEARIEEFLRHIWALDRLKKTAAAGQRTAYYRQHREREQIRKQSETIEDFLSRLGLKVIISRARPDDLGRVAELTQRTNQFNCTTIRRSEAEIKQLIARGCECEVIAVADRFGDYGIVGALIYERREQALEVDTFLLSCRALGRKVEHRMVARLGEAAASHRLARVHIPIIETAKNRPAVEFLDAVGHRFKQARADRVFYLFPTDDALNLSPLPSAAGA